MKVRKMLKKYAEYEKQNALMEDVDFSSKMVLPDVSRARKRIKLSLFTGVAVLIVCVGLAFLMASILKPKADSFTYVSIQDGYSSTQDRVDHKMENEASPVYDDTLFLICDTAMASEAIESSEFFNDSIKPVGKTSYSIYATDQNSTRLYAFLTTLGILQKTGEEAVGELINGVYKVYLTNR